MAANDDITKKDLSENDNNKIVNISERLDKLEKDVESILSDDKITDEEKENLIKEILQNEEFLKSAAETINKDSSKYDELINELKEQLYNSFDDKIDEKIEKNNANYNSIMLEQNLKNFKDISSLRKNQKDLENSITENNTKYDDIVNNINNINDKLDTHSEEYKKDIKILNSKLEEYKEEHNKFLEEEIEHFNNLKEELSHNIEEKIDEKIEKNNANYNSIMLEQNLKNFKDIANLRKSQKDLEDNLKENVSNIVTSSINENNLKYDEAINNINNKLDSHSEEYKKEIESLNNKINESKEESIKFLEAEKENLNKNYDNILIDIKDINEQMERYKSIYDEKLSTAENQFSTLMLDQNLKNYNEIDNLKKDHSDLKDVVERIDNTVSINSLKYDDLISDINNKLSDNSLKYRRELESLKSKFEESREEQGKFLEEGKENFNNLKEELYNNIEEKIDEKIEKNNANYNSIMLEQNLKNFKEISDLRRSSK